MSIINRRNAIFGWGVWIAVRAYLKQKARQAVPGRGNHAGLNKGALASIGGATLAALLFWRKKAASPDTGS